MSLITNQVVIQTEVVFLWIPFTHSISSLFIKQKDNSKFLVKEEILEKQNSHQIVFKCEDKQNLFESSSQLRI